MKLKLSYFVIPAIVILVALMGSFFTSAGMDWYQTSLIRPELTPPDWAFPIAWNIIFLLAIISAILGYNRSRGQNSSLAVFLFIFSAILNVLWTLLFFKLQLISVALIEIIILEIVNLALIVHLYKISRLSSFLLWPYGLWVGFATYLNYLIVILN